MRRDLFMAGMGVVCPALGLTLIVSGEAEPRARHEIGTEASLQRLEPDFSAAEVD